MVFVRERMPRVDAFKVRLHASMPRVRGSMGAVHASILFVHASTASVRGFMPVRARLQLERACVHRRHARVQPERAPAVDAESWK